MQINCNSIMHVHVLYVCTIVRDDRNVEMMHDGDAIFLIKISFASSNFSMHFLFFIIFRCSTIAI